MATLSKRQSERQTVSLCNLVITVVAENFTNRDVEIFGFVPPPPAALLWCECVLTSVALSLSLRSSLTVCCAMLLCSAYSPCQRQHLAANAGEHAPLFHPPRIPPGCRPACPVYLRPSAFREVCLMADRTLPVGVVGQRSRNSPDSLS